MQVPLQFVELELHQPQSLDPTLGPRGLRHGGEVGFDFALSFDDRFKQKPYVLLGVLDSVKRSLEWTAQGWKFLGKTKSLAQRVGFEPTIPIKVCPLSRQPVIRM